MATDSIGSIGAYGPTGRIGQVVGRQTVAKTGDGQAVVALRIRTVRPVPIAEAEPSARPLQAPPSQPAGRPTAVTESESGYLGPQGPQGPRIATAARTPDKLSPAEKAAVARLSQRDAQVRQEERAHAAVAGDLAGSIDYIYRIGPDGRRYAVGGSVPLRAQVSSGDPAEAARLGARLTAAAHAATNPSSADLAVARQGYRLAANRSDREDRAHRPGRALDIRA